jgi:hypothetical protein
MSRVSYSLLTETGQMLADVESEASARWETRALARQLAVTADG